MNYMEIVDILCNTLLAILSVCYLPYVVFSVLGLLFKKKYPEQTEKLRYGVIIPARNEETVISDIIRSIRESDYPKEKLDIFVIAHNCTDKTAEKARALGAIVYEYDNPAECTMGYAFRRLFQCIETDYGTKNYDGFFIFNADNTVSKTYFTKMNDAFRYFDGKRIITSCRIAGNWNEGLMTSLYGIYFLLGCIFESRGRTVAGCSTRVTGTGYLINSSVVSDGWQYVSITEDWELTSDRLLMNEKIAYCDDAVFYDEQPVSVGTMLRQRLRWQLGHLIVFKAKSRKIVKGMFSGKRTPGAGYALFDFFFNLMPCCTVYTVLYLFRYLLYLAAPLFGAGAPNVPEAVNAFLLMFLQSYLTLALSVIVMTFLHFKRLPRVNPLLLLVSCLVFPLFVFISFPLEWISLFIKKPVWTPITHSGMQNGTQNGKE